MQIEASGTQQSGDALRGKGLLQSLDEWDSRNRQLAQTLNNLIRRNMRTPARRALDIGCMQGELTDAYGKGLGLQWWGVDPDIPGYSVSSNGAILNRGFAHKLSFPSNHFDCIVLANVYEHLPPHLRMATLAEIRRVLVTGGVLVGQVPNPYFPIESHSRLPFMGYLPRSWQRHYWKLTPTGWDFDKAHFFAVTVRHLTKTANQVGMRTILTRNFNYDTTAIPKSVRWAAAIHARLGILPWAWQFVCQK